MIEVSVYRGVDGLDTLKEKWIALEKQLNNRRFFHNFGWWRAYICSLEPNPDNVYFFTFHNQGSLVGILPVRFRTLRVLGVKLREAGFPNHPHMPLQDMLYHPQADISALFNQWRKYIREEHGFSWDVMRFNGILAESALARALGEGIEKRRGQACAYFECGTSYQCLFEAFSKKFQSNIKRARKRWAKVPGIHYFSVSEPEAMKRYYADFLRIEASGWKGMGGSQTAVVLDSSLVKFYLNLIDELGSLGKARLNCLQLENEVVAANFCVDEGDTLYILKMGYEEKWAKYSPGNILLEHVLRESTEVPCRRQVNLIADMEWHRDWRPAYHEVFNLASYNATLKGQLFRVGVYCKRRIRTMMDGLDNKNGRKTVQQGAKVPRLANLAGLLINGRLFERLKRGRPGASHATTTHHSACSEGG